MCSSSCKKVAGVGIKVWLNFRKRWGRPPEEVSEYQSHIRNIFLLASRPIRVLPNVVPKDISQEVGRGSGVQMGMLPFFIRGAL